MISSISKISIQITLNSCKNVLVYYIRYVNIKNLKSIKIYSVNPLYFIFCKVNRYFEENNGNMCFHMCLLMKAKKIFKNIKNCRLKSEVYIDQ